MLKKSQGNKSFLSKLIKDLISIFPGVLSQLLSGFFGNILLGVILSPAEFGKYTLYLLSQGYLSSFLFGWLQNAIIRFLPGAEEKQKTSFFFFFLKYLFITTFFALVLGIFVTKLIKGIEFSLIILTVGIFCVSSAYSTMQCFFRSVFLGKIFSINSFIFSILKIIGFCCIIYISNHIFIKSKRIFFVLLVLLICYGIVFFFQLIQWIYYGRLCWSFFNFVNNKFASSLKYAFSYGFPLSCSLLLISFLQSIDRYLISKFLSLKEIGIYSFWMGIGMQLGQNINRLIFMTFNPRIFEVFSSLPEKANKYVYKISKFYLFLISPAFFLIGLFFPEFIHSLGIRQEYDNNRYIFLFGLFSSLFLGISQLLGKIKEFEINTLVFPISASISLLIVVVSIFICVPMFGLISACVINVGGFFIYCILISVTSKMTNFLLKNLSLNLLIICILTIMFNTLKVYSLNLAMFFCLLIYIAEVMLILMLNKKLLWIKKNEQ